LDRRFLRYLTDNKAAWIAAIVLALGLVLVFMGSRDDASIKTKTGKEEELAEICSEISGVGECGLILHYAPVGAENEGRIESVIVICDGADSAEVRLRLTEMLSSFFGIGTNRIKIEKKS
jgi:hypothetical protein